jgi:penicillin-binding protein 1A
MGKGRTGGELAAPIVADFMKQALRGKPATPFRVPRAIELIPINAKSGKRDIFGEDGVILEAFKPGDDPDQDKSVIGEGATVAEKNTPSTRNRNFESEASDPDRPYGQGVVIDGGLTTGTGGLY